MKAMLVFMDGLTDKKIVNMTVLQPLMLMRTWREKLHGDDLVDTIIRAVSAERASLRIGSFKEVKQAINIGDAVLFFDGPGGGDSRNQRI